MPDEHQKSGLEEPFLEIDTPKERKNSFTLGYVLVIIVSVLVFGFLIYYKFHTDSLAADKSATLESLISSLNSKSNTETEKKVNDINSAIKILSTEKKSKFLFKLFIDELKLKITNDIKLNNLSIDNQGAVTMDGESNNYRSVADLALSLKSSQMISAVQINGLSLSSAEGKTIVNFSLSANLANWGNANTTISDQSNQAEPANLDQGGSGE